MTYYSIPEKVNAITWFPETSVAYTATIKDIKYLQEMSQTICDNSKNITEPVTLEDIRDGNKYTVARLADGKCWMTQNLRLTRESIKAKDPSNTTGKITSADSNVGNSNATGNNYEIPASVTWSAPANKTDYQTQAGAYYNNDTTYGAYYTWLTATAGTTGSGSGGSTYDICPKGWRLPVGGPTGEYKGLASIFPEGNLAGGTNTNGWDTVNGKTGHWIGGANIAEGGAFLPAAGYVSGTLQNSTTNGYYWSGTAASADTAYRIIFSNNIMHPGNTGSRCLGHSVRCVSNENIIESERLSANDAHTDSVTGAVTVSVANTISIDAVSGTGNIEADSTDVYTGEISATIFSNTGYKVLLSAKEPDLQPSKSTNTAVIPASNSVVAGTSAWGIQNANGTYSAITTQEQEYYYTTPENTTDIAGIIHRFTIGISASPTLPADTYSTDVTITAAAV